jgi:outer membrane protein
MRRHRLEIGLAVATALLVTAPAPAWAAASTIQDALSLAYTTNPTLLSERANLRATDETVPAALSGWRPTVTVNANAGKITGSNTTHLSGTNTTINADRGTNSQALQITQPLYTGGQTVANINKSEHQVMGERARLISQEQATFGTVISDYVSVILQEQVLALDINNEQVLARQLQATNDRFRVGEITRTDVAQAEAALAQATAQRQAQEGTLQSARSQYQKDVGELPGRLVEPQPLRLPTKTLDQAKALAASNNPNVIAALFDDAAAKDNFDVQYSRLMPNLSFQGLLSRNKDVQQRFITQKQAEGLVALTVPIYQGGTEYAAIRQARQQEQQTRDKVDDARRTAINQAISGWETYFAAKASIESTRAQIRANEVALEGVQREAIVGSRTTLDVLNAEQALLQSRTSLVQVLANFVNASYTVAAAIGRLTARDLGLAVPLYDETGYYKAVRNLWIGTGDYATDQPGR